MKILMLTPYLPYPPQSGGQVRSYNLIKNLAKKHQITLFSLIKDSQEKKYVKELEKFCKKVMVFERPAKPWTIKNVLETAFSFYPFLVIRNLSKKEKDVVREELQKEEFNLIHAENFYVMPHIPSTSTPVLLTEQTILYRVYQHFAEELPPYLFFLKPILMMDILKLKYWETHFWKTADYLTAVSEEDRDQIRRFTGRKNVHIVPNGVDYSFFSHRCFVRNKYPTVLFGAADFHWMQNKEAAEILLKEVWPMIKRRVKNARLWIVGKTAPQALCAHTKEKDITIEEIDDSRMAYQKSWVLVAPIRSGGGSRTKFFEAMASGLPIVTTPEGIEGIDAKNGAEVMVENNLERLVDRAVEILSSLKKAQKISLGAKKLAEEEYDWSRSAKRLNQLYEEIGRENKS